MPGDDRAGHGDKAVKDGVKVGGWQTWQLGMAGGECLRQ